MRWTGNVTRMERREIFVGKRGGNRPLGRHRRKWEDNIKMDVRELG
jgi:hypothetical protein